MSKEPWEMLMFTTAQKKLPYEIDALKSTQETNAKTQELADETLKHFREIKKLSSRSIIASFLMSLVTIIILIVQTISTQKIELQKPIQLNVEQVKYLLREQKANNLINLQYVDSLNNEIQKLSKKLNITNKSDLKK